MGTEAGTEEPIEVEFKYGVADPRPLRALLVAVDPAPLAGFQPVGPAVWKQITDRYLDTALAGGRLEADGYRARLRRGHGAIELTVKRRGTFLGALSERLELKGVATRSRDPSRWAGSAARDRLLAIAGPARLVEIAALRQRRLVRVFRRDDTDIELSLDALEGLAGSRVAARRWEVEIELLRGDRDALGEIAAVIRALPGVHEPLGSKLEFARSVRAAATPRASLIPPDGSGGGNNPLLDSAARERLRPRAGASVDPSTEEA